MNGMAQIGMPVTIEVNYDPGLFVGMLVYDDSGASPVQIGSVTPMVSVSGTLYRAKFTPAASKSYIFKKAVYTDGTYAVIDQNFSQASESIQAVDIAALVLDVFISLHQLPGSVGAAIAAGSSTLPSQFTATIVGAMFQIIVGGRPPEFVIRLIDPSSTDPLNLAGVTEISTCFLKADGTELPISLTGGDISVLSATLGKIAIQLTSAQTALLQSVQGATLELAVSFGGDPMKYQIANAYEVLQSVC